MKISGILFDLDGTLTKPHGIDFPAVKRAIGCPLDEPAWEFILAMADEGDRQRALEILHRAEMDAAGAAVPNDGAEETILALRLAGVPLALLTRNSRTALERSFENFSGVALDLFDCALTRDDGHEPKPHPDGMLKAADILGIPAAELLCVGDYLFDVEGAYNAGAPSAYITNGENMPAMDRRPDYVVGRLDEILEIPEVADRIATEQ